MDFKKLAEVELLEEAPEGATAFAEVNGEVKRVSGGIGGGGGSGYVWDISDRVLAITSGDSSVGTVNFETRLVTLYLTEEEASNIIKESLNAGGITAYIDGRSLGVDNVKTYICGTSFACVHTSDQKGLISVVPIFDSNPTSLNTQIIIGSTGEGGYIGMINISGVASMLSGMP